MSRYEHDVGTLAIDGGKPVRLRDLPIWPHYDQVEIAATASVLRSGRVNYWTGSVCREFESAFAEYHGVKYAVSLANGTVALELALRSLGIRRGDDVVVTPRSFFASASCCNIIGATPVFADVDPVSQNITAASISDALTPNTKAIIVVHLAGWPCEMELIMELAQRRDLYVIEDCAQAHGARIGGRLVGTFGNVATFSFCQDKIISTGGEGGMLLTRNPSLWEAAWSYKDHGKSWQKAHATVSTSGFRWLHDEFGNNYRMTEIQAAIGKIQLERLDDWLQRRRRNAAIITEGIGHTPGIRITSPPENVQHAYYKYYAFVEPSRFAPGWSRDRFLHALAAEGIPGWSGSCPEIYREKAYAVRAIATLPVAQELGTTSVMLPVHPTLEQGDMADIVMAIRKVAAHAFV